MRRYYIHKRNLNMIGDTMLILKKVSASIAASRIALRTSAKLRRRIMEVARAETDLLSMSTSVPN